MTLAERERTQELDFHKRLAAIVRSINKRDMVRLSDAAEFTGISVRAFIEIWSRVAPAFIRPKDATLQ